MWIVSTKTACDSQYSLGFFMAFLHITHHRQHMTSTWHYQSMFNSRWTSPQIHNYIIVKKNRLVNGKNRLVNGKCCTSTWSHAWRQHHQDVNWTSIWHHQIMTAAHPNKGTNHVTISRLSSAHKWQLSHVYMKPWPTNGTLIVHLYYVNQTIHDLAARQPEDTDGYN